jgi:hypothetical protein
VAGVWQHVAFVEAEELIELLLPVAQEHLLAATRLILSEVEKHDDDAIELGDLRLAQVVLGDRHVGPADDSPLPRGQAHVRPARVRPLGDELGRGLASDGEVQLVLDDLEDALRVVADDSQSAASARMSRTRRYIRRSLARMSRMRSSSSSK